MAAPGIPVVTNIDGTTGPTLGGWWITLSGTGFWNARDVVDSVILQYLYLGDPFSITLTKGFAYYAANDSNFLILVPSSLSYIDKSNSNQSPPRTVLTASSLITSIEVSANGNAVFPPPLSFTYEYMPQLERIDAGTPVLWTGQTSIGIGTATLSVPAATDMTASLSSSTTGITFLDATGVAPLPSNRITFPATEDSATFSMALSAAASPGMSKITATPSNFGGAVPAPAIVQISADQIVLVVTSSTPSVLPNVISVIAGQPFTATVYVRATAAGGV
jgi:hypothetical protein